MRRRIALAIFISVAVTLLACGTAVYWVTASVLLHDLDQGLLARASARPELVDETGHHSDADHPLEPGDRYVIKNERNQTISRPPGRGGRQQIKLVSATFADLPGSERLRTIVARCYAKPEADQKATPATIWYSGSAEGYYAQLNRLFWTLVGSGVLGCGLAAVVSWRVAGHALTPLHRTADVIGTIDEQTLDQRISTDDLPVELKPVAARLNEMLHTLEQAMRRRKQFMADAAHELRTPVAALLTSLEVCLRRDRSADAYKQTVESCLVDARYLRRLVNALLQQARGELVQGAHPVESIELVSLVRECVHIVEGLATDRGVRIDLEAPLELALATAPTRLRSVLINLIGNAVDHSNSGDTVSVQVMQSDQQIRIDVSDTGPGIAAEHIASVFQPFFRADFARQASDHLGLGLFLVKTHCQAMGGDCTVQSEIGRGTTFSVRLPQKTEAPALQRSDQPGVTPGSASMRVVTGASHALLTLLAVKCVLEGFCTGS